MRFIFLCLVVLGAAPLDAATRQSAAGPLEVNAVIDGLDTPWGLAFLPDGGVLVTERGGRLLHVSAEGDRIAVDGVPEVRASGQGGLLDVLVPQDFARSREIFLSYSKPQGSSAGTAVGVGRLSEDGSRLETFRVIFEMAPGTTGGRHFGSRLVEAPDGTLFVTIGERGDRPAAQDLGRTQGSVLRISRTGGIPQDNPFAEQPDARGEIWSFGHRNPQGAALDGAGQLWVAEHGARGGDEVNLVRPGANYGWPVIAYGRHYSGAEIGEGTAKPGMEQPVHFWDPSIAPSGLAILKNPMVSEWSGDFLVGSLKFDLISRLERQGNGLSEVERLDWPETARVRDVREAPDGSIWFVSEDRGAVYRVAPAGK
ncbi:PQQ-dependent sugar dehydrogenase [Tropicimonas sp. IMCC6043]|uniref:PQQ-dependent sugar dehydrogenase n=1 Tax=Tropicimonas sp. IMCC6043 TaxID=2510645 RepID=UPI00101C4EF2|nr:PQQ-dependent sugar dehydrogenase [Tropicimonas sp. IMCC6043]RYH12049.1 PQQ-dependent sugar dehydrogenase [Tropicimonas sp. IMCC6043]